MTRAQTFLARCMFFFSFYYQYDRDAYMQKHAVSIDYALIKPIECQKMKFFFSFERILLNLFLF